MTTTAGGTRVVLGYMPVLDAVHCIERIGRGFRVRCRCCRRPVPSDADNNNNITFIQAHVRAWYAYRGVLTHRAVWNTIVRLQSAGRASVARRAVAALAWRRRAARHLAARVKMVASESAARVALHAEERRQGVALLEANLALRKQQRDERDARLAENKSRQRFATQRINLEEDELGLRHAMINQATFEAAQLQRAFRQQRSALLKRGKGAPMMDSTVSVEDPARPRHNSQTPRAPEPRIRRASSEPRAVPRPLTTQPPTTTTTFRGFPLDTTITALLRLGEQLSHARRLLTRRISVLQALHDDTRERRLMEQDSLLNAQRSSHSITIISHHNTRVPSRPRDGGAVRHHSIFRTYGGHR